MQKIPKKYASLVFTFYATMMMAFIMSAVLVALNTGIDGGWFARTLRAYVIAWPIAFSACFACARWQSNWWTGHWNFKPVHRGGFFLPSATSLRIHKTIIRPIFLGHIPQPRSQRRRTCLQQIRVLLAADKAQTQLRIVALPAP